MLYCLQHAGSLIRTSRAI